jgi:hypothetical protein
MGAQTTEALELAGSVLDGPITRTSASVIGKRGNESVIVATTARSCTISILVASAHVGLTVRPRGWLKRSLELDGAPIELAREIVDAAGFARLAALAPLLLELGPKALRLELRHGSDLVAAIDLMVALAQRVRRVADEAARTSKLAG